MKQVISQTSVATTEQFKLPALPTNTALYGGFIFAAHNELNRYTKYLSSLCKESEQYYMWLKQAQNFAAELLRLEAKISADIAKMPTSRGVRPGSKKSYIIPKKYLVAQKYGFKEGTAKLIAKLDSDCVEKAIVEAENANQVVTRTDALKIKQQKNYTENNTPCKDWGSVFDNGTTALIDKLKTPMSYTQLFANAGIGEYYLANHGFINTIANELLKERVRFYKEIYPSSDIVHGDITKPDIFKSLVDKHLAKKVKVILASPACQSFSMAGKRQINSPSALLFYTLFDFIRAVDKTNEYVLIENVKEFLVAKPAILNGTGYNNIGEYIKGELEKLGYKVNIGILDGADYGTCQSRVRAIILASKNGLWKFPKKDDRRIMLWECIGDLPSLESGEDSGILYHKAPVLPAPQVAVLKHTPTGCSAHKNPKKWQPVTATGAPSNAQFDSDSCRKSWDKPCNTITMNSASISGNCSIHPGRPLSDGTYSDARCLTVLELLRVTGLPDNYPIPDWASDTLIRDVIGECFLPRMVERLMQMMPGVL